jgi:hypothetical protein
MLRTGVAFRIPALVQSRQSCWQRTVRLRNQAWLPTALPVSGAERVGLEEP